MAVPVTLAPTPGQDEKDASGRMDFCCLSCELQEEPTFRSVAREASPEVPRASACLPPWPAQLPRASCQEEEGYCGR